MDAARKKKYKRNPEKVAVEQTVVKYSSAACEPANVQDDRLTVGSGNTLHLVTLLDGVRVGRALGSVDELVSEALGDRLDVAEGRLSGTGGQESDGGVNTSERRNIDGLATDSTSRADTGRVFTRTSVDDGVNEDLDRVGVGKQVDDLESVGDNANSHELLAVVAAVHHERVDKTLHDGGLGLLEGLVLVTASSVGSVDGIAQSNVVGERDVLNLDLLGAVVMKSRERTNRKVSEMVLSKQFEMASIPTK